jgi:hypothetical protein
MSQYTLHQTLPPLEMEIAQFEFSIPARDRSAGTTAVMVVSFQHSAISSGTSAKSQGWWLKLSVQCAVQSSHVRQLAIFTLHRVSAKVQAQNHLLNKGTPLRINHFIGYQRNKGVIWGN